MKATTFLGSLFLSTALAQDAQIPLKEKAAGWFDKAKSYIPSVAPPQANPIGAGASAFVPKNVHNVNIKNYDRILQPKAEGEEEWLIYFTGGNKTCFGRCGPTDSAWSESIPLFATIPKSAGSPSLHLGQVDCEKEAVLCAAWAASCPSIFHFLIPSSKGQSTPLRVVELNRTTITPAYITQLASSAPNSKVMDVPTYDGVLHPVDGAFAKVGAQIYLGYLIWVMGATPSWLVMIGISFISRQVMSRRAINRSAPDMYAQRPAGGAGAGAPVPPARPAGGKSGTPGSAGKGGKKRR